MGGVCRRFYTSCPRPASNSRPCGLLSGLGRSGRQLRERIGVRVSRRGLVGIVRLGLGLDCGLGRRRLPRRVVLCLLGGFRSGLRRRRFGALVLGLVVLFGLGVLLGFTVLLGLAVLFGFALLFGFGGRRLL